MKACVFYMMIFFVMVGFAGVVMVQEAVARDDANEVKVNEKAVDDANGTAPDANSAEKKDELKGVRNKLRGLDRAGERQGREWIRRRLDRVRLAETAEEQIVSELNLIRSVAFEEGATKTMAVIDFVMDSRKARLNELMEALARRALEEKKEREEQGTRGRTDRRRRDRDR